MNSDTLIESSPAKDSKTSVCSYIKEDFKRDMRNLLSPLHNKDVILGLPMSWKDELMYYHQQLIPANRYLVPSEEVESWLFPRIRLHHSIKNIGVSVVNEHRVEIIVDWWYSMFELSVTIRKRDSNVRLKVLENLIKRYVSFLDIENQPFEILTDNRPLNEFNIACHQTKFRPTGSLAPYFRILMMDAHNPAILLWQDDENLCGFDIFRMNNDFYLQVRLVHSIIVFIEEASLIKKTDTILLL